MSRKAAVFNVLVVVALVMGLLPLPALAASPSASSANLDEPVNTTQPDNPVDKIEPLVLEQLTTDGRTDFFVWMKEKADLSPAYKLKTKQERGRFVYETLRAVAERTQKDVRAYLDRQGVQYQSFYIANKILVRGSTQTLLMNLAARADVAKITANHKYQLPKPFVNPAPAGHVLAVEPNISFINADDVWAMGYTGQGTVVAGNDTGLDETHPTIAPHYRGCLNPPACTAWDHNYNWWDATYTYMTDPYDGHGHGTHTTGTMVGDDGAGNQIGVAPGAQTIHCKNMTDGGSGDDGTFTECFQWDLAPWDLSGNNPRPDLAPDAINNSWGYWGGGAPQFEDEIIALQTAGIAVEVSAGNEGSSCATLRSPGDYARVLTTGSVNHSGGVLPGTLTGFSSRGPSSLYPGDYFPDVMAPGENIRSSLPGGSYSWWSGTSMAGPHTTALIGLLWSAAPALRGQVETTYQIIKDTAVPLTGQYGSSCGGDYTEGPNNDWGFGTIDALAAVQRALLMSGAGYLNGVVTDADNLWPIEGATIVAQHDAGYTWNATTDSSGYYTLTVAAGVFTVTATHPHYLSSAVTGVVVVTDTTTTQDFSLTMRGLLFGFVTDADNGTPLQALVTADNGTTANTDPATGYYQMWLDPGVYTVTATAQNYAPESAAVTIVSGAVTQQDFALLAAVVFVPSPIHVTIPLGTYASVGATLTNRQPWDYAFEFKEQAGGFTPLGRPAVKLEPLPGIPAQVFTGAAPDGYESQPAVETTQPGGVWQTRASAPFTSMDNVYVDYENKGYLVGGYGANGQVGIYDADTDTWTTGATEPSPIQYPVDGCFGLNADGDPVVVLFNDTVSGVTTLHRYNIATDSWDTPPVPADFPANGLWAHDVASVWRYSGENVCYISGGATAAGGGNTSALYAYYPDSNTAVNLGDFSYLPGGFDFHASWYVPWIGSQGGICVGGGVNSANVVSADTQCYDIGAGVFNAVNADLGPMPAGVWGMADDILYEGGDYQLWIANGVDASSSLWPNSAYYSQNDGQWYIGPVPSRVVYRVEGVNIAAGDGASFYVVGGSTGGFSPSSGHERNYSPDYPPVFGQDVLWFGQVPVSGVVPASDSLIATMLFSATHDAGVHQPGDYEATLNVQGSPRVKVPVKMTVEAPATWGKLEGTVTGLGACDANPAPLKNAQVIVEGSLGTVVTLTTNAAGYYQLWLDEAETPLAVTVTDPDHEVGVATGVVIVAGATTTVDFSLRWLRACLTVEAPPLEATLNLGDSATLPLTLTNTGAGAATFAISDRETGFTPAVLAQGHGEWLYRAETGVLLENNSGQTTLAYPAAFRWTPDKPLLAVNILIYTDDPYHNPKYLDTALQALGLAYTAHYDGDWSGFEADLNAGTWDAVFVAGDSYWSPSSVLTALNTYVLGGGKLAYHSWTVGSDPGNALWTTLGFTFIGNDYDPPDPVYWWDAGHPVFNNPEAVPEFTVLDGGLYRTYGQQVEPLPGFESLAGYTTPGPDPNQAALVLGNDGRTLFRAFLDAQNGADLDGDGRLDGVELWMNIANGVLNGFGGDAPWLYENPLAGTVPPDGGQVLVDVTFDAAAVGQPGEYLATLQVDSDDPLNNRYTFPARMLVSVPPDYGKLEGVVSSLGHCDVNPTPLYKADVVIESAGGVTYSLPTAPDGSYSWWLKEGDYTVMASSADHTTETASVTIVAQQTTLQDLALRWLKPCLSVDPQSLEAALEMGANTTVPLTLQNTGAGMATFELREQEQGFAPLMLGSPLVATIPAGPLVAPEGTAVAGGAYTSRPARSVTIAQRFILGAAPNVLLLSADDGNGEPMRSLLQAYGDLGMVDVYDARYGTPTLAELQAYDVVVTWSNYVYQDAVAMGNVLADYVDAGGKVINLMFSMGTHGWQMGGRFMDAGYTAVNGTSLNFAISCLGGYDAAHPVMSDPTVITSVCDYYRLGDTYLTPGAAAIAYWQDGTIFVGVKDDQSVVSINAYVGPYYQWSGQMDAVLHNAILWLVGGGDAPWLSEDPITGTVGADSAVVVDVTFDAGVPEVTQPGEYYATLKVLSDDPVQGKIGVPVTLTVSAPATWGKLEGTVSGLGYCDVNPAPLKDAVVFIEGSDGVTWTLTTGADGKYVLWLDEAHSPLTVTVTAAEHESGVADGVVIVGQQTTTQDFALRWLKPCLSVDPVSLEAALEMGANATVPLTLTNTGAGAATVELREQDRGFQVTLGGPGSITWLKQTTEGVAVTGADSGATLAFPKAYRYTPAYPTAGYNILMYVDEWWHIAPNTYPEQAIARLGLAATVHADGDYAGFESDLVSGGPWDLVVWQGENYYAPGSTLTALLNYVQSGGKLAGTYWQQLSIPADPLWAAMGFAYVANDIAAMPAYWWEAEHPLFNEPESAPEWLTRFARSGTSQGTYLEPLANGEAVAGYTLTPTPGQAAIVIGNNGQTVYKGIRDLSSDADDDGDGVPDAVELWENIITGLLQGFSGDAPWLSENPITGTVAADGGTALVDVTFDAGVPEVTQPGEYYATLNVHSDDPVQGKIGVPVTLTVLPLPSMGRVHGYVLDACTGAPVEATVDIAGGNPISQTQSNKDTGYYSAWLYAGDYPLTFSATGYLDAVDNVTIIAGETVAVDVSMTPDRPCIAVAPNKLEAWVLYGTEVYTHPVSLDLLNKGGQDLTYEILETESTLTLARSVFPPVVGDSATAPTAYKPSLSRSQLARTYLLGGTAAVFKDADPWGTTDVEAFLTAQGIPYEVHTSAEFGTLDFNQFGMIVISSDQPQTFYDNYAAYVGKFEDYVAAGGFLNFFSADSGWNGGALTAPLPGGMNWAQAYEDSNVINDPAHPVVQGVPSPFYGNSASHGHFLNLPANAHIIASEVTGGQPTIVEYGLGAGWLIAFGQPLEVAHAWGWDAGLIMENTLLWGYSFIPTGDVPWVWEEPVSGTVAAGDTANVAVMFTALYTDSTPMPLGDYTAALLVNNNAAEGRQRVPVLMHIISQMVTPTAAFTATTPVCIGADAWFYFTGDKGLPFANQYTWWFGDGASVTRATADPVSHAYTVAGVYTVTLEVCNDVGCDTAMDVVEVTPLPVAGFNASASELTVSFTNTSLHAHSYFWDFGDGVTSNEVDPVHTYPADGTYTVTLQALNDCGYDVYTAALTVYAEYMLDVNIVGSGAVAKAPDQATYHYGDVVTLTATADPGWTFAEWDGGVTDNPKQVTIFGDTVVTATFTQDEYTLDVNVVGSGAVAKAPDQATYHYGDVVTLTATADPGWTFAEWDGGVTDNPKQVTIHGNTVVTATFTQDEYTLDVNVVGSGAVAKAPDQATYHYGDVVTLTATADPGWSFAEWDGGVTDNPKQVTIFGDTVVTATFTQDEYTLTVNIVGSGAVAKAPDQATYHYGDVVTLTATADPGWTFAEWDGGVTDNPKQVTIHGHTVVTATFTQDEYTLDVNIVGSGAVAKAPDQATYHYGDVVTLTATADPGWYFSGWSGDLGGLVNPQPLLINGNKAVTATFTAQPPETYTLTVNVVGNGVVTWVPAGTVFVSGTPVALTATPDPGWSFAGWSGDLSGMTNPANLTMDGNKVVTATFTQDEYTLDVNVVGSGAVAKAPDQATYHYGDVVTLTATADPGWSFAGWSGGLTGNPTQVTIRGHTVVTATFTQDEYTLDVNIVGSGAVAKAPDQATYHYGDVVTLTATADPGWYFSGWSGDLGGLVNPQPLLINGNKAVTATFTAQPPVIYTLDVNTVGNGTVTWTPPGTEFVTGTLVTLIATADPNWRFVGWSGDLSGMTNPANLTMDGNKVVTATFTQDEYTLDVNVVGSGAVAKAPDQATYHYGDVVTLTATADPGWSFAGWSGGLTGNPTQVTIHGHTVVTATFTQDEYTLDVNIVGSGAVAKAPNQTTYHYGDVVTLTATADPGWTFAGWSGGLTGNPTQVTIRGHTVVTATFTQDEYTLDVNIVGNGAVAKAPDQATYHYGDVVTLTATADPGWYFSGWSGDLGGLVNPQPLLINGNKAVTATFTAQPPETYTLTVNVVGNGVVTWVPAGTVFVSGTPVALTATPDPGWSFAGWSGDLSGMTNPANLTMDGNKVVTATFTQDEYTLDVNVVGSGAVAKAPDQATYHYGDVVTLTATADPGWSFAGWSGGLTGNPTQVTIRGHTVVTATFTQDEYTLDVNIVGSGAVAKAPDQATYHYGDVVTLTATADPGWYFSGWSGDLGGLVNPQPLLINGNKAVTATFTAQPPVIYTLDVNTVGNGTVTWTPPGTEFVTGTLVTLIATADPNWRFVGWSGDLSGMTNPANLTMDGNKVVTATFTQDEYTLDVNVVGSGAVAKAPDQATYHYGDVVTLTATADPGWSFAGWSGGLTGNPTQVTIHGHTVVTATFTQDEYTLDVNIVGSGAVAKAPNQTTYHYGDVVTLTATADPGWTFAGWSGGLTGNPTQVTIRGHTVVTATFTQDEYTLDVNIVGNGAVAKAPNQATYHYGDVVTLTATADPGWSFAGWSGALSGTTNPANITMNGNKVVTATFTQSCIQVAGVDFSWSPTQPFGGEVVTFNASVLTGTAPFTYTWNIAGESKSGSSVTHTFPTLTTAQSYNVTLTVFNACTPNGVARERSIIVRPRAIYLPLVMRNVP